MLVHPALSLFFISLLSSIFITISANSWFMGWLGLEVNLLSFIPLIINKKNKYSVESALKYFLIQALASIFFIASSSMEAFYQMSILLPTIALMLKAGAAPSHQWLPSMVEGLSWPLIAVLTTIQKMNPLILIFFLLKPNMLVAVMYFFILSSAMIGATGGLTQTSLRKIMAYSTITHLAWMLSILLLNSWAWLMYFIFYVLVLFSLIFLLNYSQMSYLNQLFTMKKSYLSFLTASSILSLGGLPPFSGFLPKLMAMCLLLPSSHTFLLLPLLSASFISLFFYLRFLLTSLLLSTSSMKTYLECPDMNSNLLHFNLIGLFMPSLYLILMLSFKLYKT